jgi:phosphonate transport system ATP-binding protein
VGGLLDQRVDRLSCGQQQRVAVARALVQDGDLFLADEPVASVDGETAEVIMEILADLARAGRSVLVSLHQPGLATRYCDRVVPLAVA